MDTVRSPPSTGASRNGGPHPAPDVDRPPGTIGNVCAWRLALRVDVLEPTLGELIRESILTTDAQAQA